ncbi:MAG: 4'-phosphopantetheinyl transferase superfamily protein [Ruminococcaceae bacterium]|nr:4'-phosphopantetheinyl transferase superfamily protein [Oscillospiraceae bacterium]
MIYIYKSSINDISIIDYENEYSCLSQNERQRLSVYKGEKDKKRSLATKVLLRKAVLEKYSIKDFSLKRAENGKPFLDFCKLSLSHSGDMAVCAVSSNEVGIDIEKIKDIKPRNKYKLFTPDENDYVNKCDDNKNIRFLEIWTRKEALLKCSGIMGERISKQSVLDNNSNYVFKTEILDGYVLSSCEPKI